MRRFWYYLLVYTAWQTAQFHESGGTDIMKTELHNVISFSNSLIRMKQYDAVFHLLETYMFSFPLKLTDFYHQNFSFFISSPISPAFKSFFVKTSYIENLFHQDQKLQLIKLIENKLCIYPIIILQLISDISPNIFVDQNNLFKLVIEQTNHKNYRVRRYCASALFNLSKSMPDLDQNALIKKLLDKATIDKNIIVRHSFIKVIYQHCNISFAGTDFLKYYKTFLNDDSFKVPKITLKILCKLAEYNPIAVTSITRGMLFDYFSVFQTVPSIRQQAKFAKLLPFLVKASLNIVKTFSESLIMTLETVLSPEYTNKNFQNFVHLIQNYKITFKMKFNIKLKKFLVSEKAWNENIGSDKTDPVVFFNSLNYKTRFENDINLENLISYFKELKFFIEKGDISNINSIVKGFIPIVLKKMSVDSSVFNFSLS